MNISNSFVGPITGETFKNVTLQMADGTTQSIQLDANNPQHRALMAAAEKAWVKTHAPSLIHVVNSPDLQPSAVL
ncbi:MAG: hypothetical protein P4L87_23000 [Formivibrio sp.]|nr:hypothetical protein [Formivibrio sp.]